MCCVERPGPHHRSQNMAAKLLLLRPPPPPPNSLIKSTSIDIVVSGGKIHSLTGPTQEYYHHSRRFHRHNHRNRYPWRPPPARALLPVRSSLHETLSASAAAGLGFRHPYSSLLTFFLADSVTDGGYSQASYYTSLGLFVISVPGLWSLIKRSVKSKVVSGSS